MEDFTQLASSGLPSLGASFDSPTWNRSLLELKAASDSLWSYNKNASPPTDSTRISSMAGSRRLPELGRFAGSSERDSSQPPLAETDFLQWGEANRRREIDILKRIVNKAEETTRQKSQELVEKQLQDDWERTRGLWSRELVGTRTLGGSAAESTVVSKHIMLENSTSTGYHAPLLLPGIDQHARDPTARYIDPQVVCSHMEIVKRLKEIGKQDFQVFAEAANELVKVSPQDSPQNKCYATALELTSRILTRRSFSPVETALATLGHLASQFETWIISKVRTSNLPGQDVNQGSSPMSSNRFRNANANTIASFVSVELGATTGSSSFWPALYYALRIGDAVAAKEIFESNSAGTENDETKAAITGILSALVQRQGTGATIWDAQGPLALPAQFIRDVGEACERAKTAERVDNHRIGFLSLLSGTSELPMCSVAGLSTIEDYLFGLLWMALQDSEPVKELENVGKKILGFGASYFSDQDSGGWSYSLPLIAVQQYRTALSYLVKAGGSTGLMQATHLGMLLSFCGAALDDLGEANPQSQNSLITSLLVNYATWLHADQNCGAIFALVYLVWVPSWPILMKEIVSIMLQANEVRELAGDLSPEGTRMEGALDIYFGKAEISSLLKQAAESLAKDAGNREKAAGAGTLFMLAGDFRSVLLLLGRLLSPGNDADNEERKHWYEQAKLFFATYLQNGRTHVLECLEKNDDLDALRTCKTLMELVDFFDLFEKGAYNEAWGVLDKLDVLPKSHSELSSKEIRYRNLDPLLQRAIPSVLMAALQSLAREYTRLKHSGAKDTSQNVLLQLKERGSALITFASLIPNVAPEKIEAMSRLEASMI